MKRVLWFLGLLISALILSFILFVLLFAMLSGVPTTDADNTTVWQWIREDSYLVDIELDADNETVTVLYSFCFTNPTEDTYALAPISANFARKDLAGWMKYQQFFRGERPDGDYYTLLQPQTTTNVVYSFSGEYLGGEISTHIEPPAEILYMYKLSYPE